MKNTLYFGDCLQAMREDIADESVDSIYLDPPFNSKRIYNAFMGGAQWAAFDKFRFERWAAALIDGMEPNVRQRGDKGIDGRGRLALRKGVFVDLVSQVKGGKTGAPDVRAFNGARLQAGADMGIFICFEDRVTQGMKDAAASAGIFMNAPTMQIYTVEDYFEGRTPVFPRPRRSPRL